MAGQILLEDFSCVLILAFSLSPVPSPLYYIIFFPDLQKLMGKMSSETHLGWGCLSSLRRAALQPFPTEWLPYNLIW